MRKLTIILFILSACLAAVTSPVWTQDGATKEQGFVEGLVQRLLSTQQSTVKVVDIGISLDGNVTAGRIELHDQKGAWLVLENAALDWQPFSLLSSTLQVKQLAAKRISVSRLPLQLPDAGRPEEADGLGGVVVDRLVIGELDVANAVFGHAIKIAAEGSMKITQDPRVITVKLSAKHTDKVAGRLDAAISYGGPDDQLSVDITMAEGRGGVVSALLPIDDDADVELRVIGEGAIDDWTGRLSFSADAKTVVDGRARIGRDGEDRVLSLDLAGAVDALTPDRLDQVFAGRTELSVAARYAAGKPVRLERAELTTATVMLSAKGSVDTDGPGTSIVIEAKTLGGKPLSIGLNDAPFDELSLTAANITARAQGPLNELEWTLLAQAQAVSAADVAVQGLRIDAKGTGLAPAPDTASTADISVKGTIEAQRTGALPPLFAGAFDAQFGLRLTGDDIALTKGRIEADHYNLAASGLYGFEDAAFELDVDLSAQSPGTGNPAFDPLLQGPVRLAGRVTGRSFDQITFNDVSFVSQALEARINGQYDTGGDTELSADAVISRLDLLHSAAGGSVSVNAHLKGPFDALQIDITGRGEQVVVAGRAVDDLKLAVKGMLDNAVPRLDIALDGAFIKRPFQLTAKLTGDEAGALRLGDIDGRIGPAAVDGELSLASDGMPGGAVTLTIDDLAALSDPALQGLQGSLKAHVAISALNGQSVADVYLRGSGLVREDISVATLDMKLKAADLLGEPRLSGSGTLADTRFGTVKLGTLELDVEDLEKNTYRVNLRDKAGTWTANTVLGLRFEDAVTILELNTLAAQLGGTSVALSKPTTLRIAPDAVVLARTEISAGTGTVVAAGTLSPALSLQVKVDRLPLAVLTPVLPDQGLQGSVTGTIVAEGSLEAPRARVRLNGQEVSVVAMRTQGLSPVSFKLDGDLADEVLSLRGSIKEGGAPLSVSGTVDLRNKGRADLAVTGTLPSGLLARLGSRNGLIVKGTARVELKVSGPLDNIGYSGTIATQGATLGDAAGQFTMRDVSARLVIDGETIRVAQFTGTTAGGNGRVAISGVIGLAGNAQSNLNITVSKGRYTDGTLLVTLFDAKLTLRGVIGSNLVLGGTVDLFKPKVTLNEPLPASLAPLSVKHRAPPPDVRRQQRQLQRNQNTGVSGTLNIDIEIRTADRIVVTGRGVNAELGGSLRLTGPVASPRANGAFRLRRGSVKLLSRKLEFSHGQLDFTGNLNPQLLFSGSVRTDRATITLTISGSADVPRVTVSSVPDLPQEEALAVLLFGRSISELAPLQIAQMAGSVALLSGGSGGGLFDGLTDLLGSTNIEMVRTEKGGTAVSIGRQINDRLSIGVQQDTDTGTRRIEVDLELTRKLKLRGSVGDDRSTKAGIFFEKEY